MRLFTSHRSPNRKDSSESIGLNNSGERSQFSEEQEPKVARVGVNRLSSWPEQGAPLKQHDWVSRLFVLGDVILVLLPIYFILLAIAVVRLDGQPVLGNAFASKVLIAIQLGPTLFPIMFAAISGRSMKMIARYLAEKGAKLSTLELLMASQSVWGTIESQILMRRLTFVGANLLFLWTMSPLGGQASLRLLETTNSTIQDYQAIRYLSTGPGSAAFAMTSGAYVENDGGLTQVESSYAAALLAPNRVKSGAEDTWGNVKIPYFDARSTTQGNADNWVDFEIQGRHPEDYMSLVGIPIVGRPTNRDGSFSLETTQLTLECDPFTKAQVDDRFDWQQLERLVPGQPWQNMTDTDNVWGNGDVIGGKRATFFLQTDIPLTQGGDDDDGRFNLFTGFINASMTARDIPKRKITFASMFGFEFNGATTLNIANCSLGQFHTETQVQCTKDQCAAVRVRPSRIDTRDQNVTPFDHILISDLVLKAFPKAFGWSRGSSATEQFLYNTTSFQVVSPTTILGKNDGQVDLATLTPEVFSKRLALLLNTYYQLTLAPNAYMGDIPQNNFTVFGPDTTPVNDIDAYLSPNVSARNTSFENWYSDFSVTTYNDGLFFVGATANATVSDTQAIFACNFAWLGLLLVASSVVFLTGVGSLFLKSKTLAPEMFGYVASMTYENNFIDIPEGGTTLDAMERARLLKHVTVHIGDVHANEDVGHIALTAGTPLRNLERGRLYH